MSSARQEANRKIMETLGRLVEKYPDWRFQQILQNSGAVMPNGDQWYEESEQTLGNIEKTVQGW